MSDEGVENEIENVCSEVLLFRARWSDLSPADHVVPSDRGSEYVQIGLGASI